MNIKTKLLTIGITIMSIMFITSCGQTTETEVKEDTFSKVNAEYEQLTKYLIENDITVSTMESCTGGLISSLITDTEGSSSILQGAFVTYSNNAKLLQGVDEKTLITCGVYSADVAQSMATACQSSYDTDLGIGITGSFGNTDPNNSDSVDNTVYIAVSYNNTVNAYSINLPEADSRLESKYMVADAVYTIVSEVIGMPNE